MSPVALRLPCAVRLPIYISRRLVTWSAVVQSPDGLDDSLLNLQPGTRFEAFLRTQSGYELFRQSFIAPDYGVVATQDLTVRVPAVDYDVIVQDLSGHPIPRALVRLSSKNSSCSARTNSRGIAELKFVFLSNECGELRVTCVGYEENIVRGLRLKPGAPIPRSVLRETP
ncbi:MAG: hypothetical protein ACI8X5_001953 [Planctomycetota bacterium]|jgi:hypothetical protein